MKKTTKWICGLGFALGFSLACGVPSGEPEAALGQAQEAITATRYDRSVKFAGLTRSASGQWQVSAKAGLQITDTSNDTLNLTADVEVTHNGRPAGTIKMPDVVKHSAVTCAVTCNAACPSIFGAGICHQCGCVYEPIFTIPMPWDPKPGDVISLKTVPARGGLPETYTADDTARYVVP